MTEGRVCAQFSNGEPAPVLASAWALDGCVPAFPHPLLRVVQDPGTQEEQEG